jgi:diguanylate cyclase (GGDEF)-like protein
MTFLHLNRAQGLSQGTVTCMLQDRQGFLWFGTERGGLNRYDGNRFTAFHHNPAAAQSLVSETVTCLLETRNGDLWVGTDSGLDRIDHETRAIRAVKPAPGDSGFPDDISSLAEDAQGNVWVGTGTGGLFVLPQGNPAGPGPRRVPQELIQGGVSCLFVDGGGTLWVGMSGRGLFRQRPGKDGGPFVFERIEGGPQPEGCLSMAQDPLGVLWIGTRQGLFSLLPGQGPFRRYRSAPGDPKGLHGDLVRRVYVDRGGILWVGTDGGGLHRILPRSDAAEPPRFRWIHHDRKEPGSMASDAVESIFEDRSGVLWVGTFGSGLNKLVLNPGRVRDREKESLLRFATNAADPASLGGNLVNTILEDRFGNLWVGIDGAGIDRVTPPASPQERLRFDHFRPSPATGLEDGVITCSLLDAGGQLWLGSFTGGLIRVDQTSAHGAPTFRHFRPDPAQQASSMNFLNLVAEDRARRLWVGTAAGGLHSFDRATGAFRPIRPAHPPADWNPAVDYVDFHEDAYGTLWLAGRDGVDRFNPATGEIRTYRHSERPDSLGFRGANALALTRGDRLAIAGNGGLDMAAVPPWDGPPPSFTHYGTRDGLPNDLVLGLQEDSQGILWVSTLQALCRFDPSSGKARPFLWHPDLQGTEFFPKADFRAQSGEIFFGGSNGLFLFHPDEVVYNTAPAPLALTDFQLFGQSVPMKDYKGAGGLTLTRSEYLFSLEFAALHYVAPEANRYAYMLEGLDRAWTDAGNRHFVTYTTLPPGDYTFRARGFNCDGMPLGGELMLKIHVKPPFWWSPWFWVPLGGALGGLAVLLVRLRIRSLTRLTRRLRELVDARTRELALANKALLDQSLTDALTGLHNRRYLEATIPGILAQAVRAHHAATAGNVRNPSNNFALFAMVDLDHFKIVNDTHGHPAGDRVLQQVGELLRQVARGSDTVVRMGGEEFLLIARATGLTEAPTLPERIRSAVEAHAFDLGSGSPLRCTCSVGFCLFPIHPAGSQEPLPWEQILEVADACLYAAKRNGRNAWVGLVPMPDPAAVPLPEWLPEGLRAPGASEGLTLMSSLGPGADLR